MKFSALHFFKFASRVPQIAQILVSTFKIFQGGAGGWGGGGGGGEGAGPEGMFTWFLSEAQAKHVRTILLETIQDASGS